MEEVIGFIVKCLMFCGCVGLLIGTFFMLELLFGTHICH
jgi:hypothetical protein